uniref:Peptidase S1 domain-containing protein n=1 Tax=Chelonoidis abingdonii TaxID=106734 RepID=A0A8C0JC83_CHEAB
IGPGEGKCTVSVLWLCVPHQNRIIGGTECPESEHPWLVLLYYFDQHYCSGTLLNPTWVLTAAHCHRDYENDIMLLRLSPPASYTNYVQPLALTDSCPLQGTNCTVMGWGTITSPAETYPDVPQCVNINIVSNTICQDAYPEKVTENMLCAGVLEGGKDSSWCGWVSMALHGSILLLFSGHSPISSHLSPHHPCAQPNKPGVYTSINRCVVNKT